LNRRVLVLAPLVLLGAVVAGCGGSSGPPQVTGPAPQFHLGGFLPSGPVQAGKPATVSFKVIEPSGQTMTKFKRGSGPHTGVHLIIVRNDLSVIESRPFIAPETGKIAVKVINHYGDEVMKVYAVA
jgi:hypothetical protein